MFHFPVFLFQALQSNIITFCNTYSGSERSLFLSFLLNLNDNYVYVLVNDKIDTLFLNVFIHNINIKVNGNNTQSHKYIEKECIKLVIN